MPGDAIEEVGPGPNYGWDGSQLYLLPNQAQPFATHGTVRGGKKKVRVRMKRRVVALCAECGTTIQPGELCCRSTDGESFCLTHMEAILPMKLWETSFNRLSLSEERIFRESSSWKWRMRRERSRADRRRTDSDGVARRNPVTRRCDYSSSGSGWP